MSGLLPRSSNQTITATNIVCNSVKAAAGVTANSVTANTATFGTIAAGTFSIGDITIGGDITITTEPPFINGTGNDPTTDTALMWNPSTSKVNTRADLVTVTGAQTLTNKTLQTPNITSLSNQTYAGGYLPIGAKFDTGAVAVITDVTTNSQTQTLTNKTINSASNTIQVSGTSIDSLINQDVRTTAQPSFSGITATTLARFPTGTIIGGASNRNTIFYNIGTPSTSTEITWNQSANRVWTCPDASGAIVIDTATQTLTNKTLTAPVISTISNGGTVTIPSGTDTLVNLASAQTLTSKTISFPTTGGTPTALSYYEYFQQATTMSGIWSAAQNITLTIERLGNRVTIGWNALSATTNTASVITVAYTIPTRLRPTNQNNSAVAVVNAGFIANGLFELTTAGVMRFYATIAGGNFTSGALGGTSNTSVTYFITQ